MLISKPIELSDYEGIQEGLAAAYYSNAVCLGADLPIYIPHAHRMWEYGSALQTLLEHPSPTKIIDIGCGHSILGPAAFFARGVEVTETDPLGRYAERGKILHELLDGKYTFRREALPEGPEAQYSAVFSISVMEHIRPGMQRMAWKKLADMVEPGGVLVVTVDYSGEPGFGDSPEREMMFSLEDLYSVFQWLEEDGIKIPERDVYSKPPLVNDYTFFRIVGKRV